MDSRKKNTGISMVFQVAWPAVLESFFVALAGVIDVFMVSTIGAEAVAAVGLTTQPKFLGLCTFFAMNIPIASLIARRKGENNQRTANETLAEAVWLTVLVGIVLTILCVGFADPVIRLCGSMEDTHESAVIYFRIIMGGMMFNVINMCLNAAQRGAGNTRIAMYTNVISSIVNVCGNYVLIGGHFGFPKLGIVGAGLATVLGTVVACVISIIALFDKQGFLNWHIIWKEKLGRSVSAIKMILKLSVSTFTEQVLLRIGFMATAIMAADMGTGAMAAHQVGMNALSLSFAFGDGMQAAAVTLIGQKLGEEKQDEADYYGKLCQKLGLLLGLLIGLFYFFFGRTLFALFFQEADIIQIGVGICRCIMIIVLFQVPQVVFTGCLRGAGDVKWTMFSSMICVTIVRSAASYFFCYICGFGIYGIWMGILADQFGRLILGAWRYRSKKWLNIKI